MHAITHLVIAIAAAIVFKIQGIYAVIFIIASVLIDLDHITDGKVSIKGRHIFNPMSYAKEVNYAGAQKSIHIFHTFEFMVFLFVVGFYSQLAGIIFYAFSLRIFLDAIGNIWSRNIGKSGTPDWYKYWFVFYYLTRKKVEN